MDPNIDCAVKIFYNLNCIDNFNDFSFRSKFPPRAMNGNTQHWARKQFYLSLLESVAASEDN